MEFINEYCDYLCEECPYSIDPYQFTEPENAFLPEDPRGRAYRRAWKINELTRARNEIRKNGWASRYYYPTRLTKDWKWIEDTSRPRKIVHKSKKFFKRTAARAKCVKLCIQ